MYAQDLAIKPPRARAVAATIMLGACALILAVQVGTDLWAVHLMDTADADEALDVIDFLDALSIVQAVSIVAAAVAFIVWLWRARSNAENADEAPQHWGRPWLIFGWLVPVVNFWVPQRVVADIWKSSALARRTVLVNTWWLLYLVYLFAGRIVSRTEADSLDALRTRIEMAAVAGLIGILAAILAIAVVWRITRAQVRQAEHLARLVAYPAPPAPGPARTGHGPHHPGV